MLNGLLLVIKSSICALIWPAKVLKLYRLAKLNYPLTPYFSWINDNMLFDNPKKGEHNIRAHLFSLTTVEVSRDIMAILAVKEVQGLFGSIFYFVICKRYHPFWAMTKIFLGDAACFKF